MRLTNLLNLPAPGRRQTLYVHLTCLQSAVFLLNSRSHLFTATLFCSTREGLHILRAHLLPKLRCHFAEFLHQSYLNALVFSTCPPVSVCGTVQQCLCLEAFPGSRASMTSLYTEVSEPLRTSGLMKNRICQVYPPTCKYQDNQRLAHLAFFVPTSPLIKSPGILTWFPSTTLFSLALGADSPCSD